MKIKRWHARKINLGNYETADFGCELEVESNTENAETNNALSQKLNGACIKNADEAIKQYQVPKTTKEEIGITEANLKVSTDELEVLKRLPKENEGKIKVKKFEISLYKNLLKQLKGR